MPIAAELITCVGSVRERGQLSNALIFPPKKVTRIALAGFIDILQDAEVLVFRNLSTSQTVYIRLNTDADNTAAADADDKSLRVEVGETITFGLTHETDATGYKLSVA